MKKLALGLALALVLGATGARAAQPLLTEDRSGRPMPVLSPAAATKVAYTTSPGTTGALSSTVVRIVCSSDCYYVPGADPTATTSSHFLPGGLPYDIRISAGWKVSFVQVSAAGTAYVTEWQ